MLATNMNMTSEVNHHYDKDSRLYSDRKHELKKRLIFLSVVFIVLHFMQKEVECQLCVFKRFYEKCRSSGIYFSREIAISLQIIG